MDYQAVFNRYELKYLITKEKKKIILDAMKPYMLLDEHGKTTIRNLYFDTDNYQLVRRSIESPIYKEKLRIRSYCKASEDTTVFIELKKKYDSLVYKRRIALFEKDAENWFKEGNNSENTQISNEIDYFVKHYSNLKPVVFLSYEREAYFTKEESDFRVTFDDSILFRENELSLNSSVFGTSIIPNDMVLMEIKCSQAIPIWMASALSKNKIYKTSFSKYGEVYKSFIYPKMFTINKEVF